MHFAFVPLVCPLTPGKRIQDAAIHLKLHGREITFSMTNGRMNE